MGARLETLILSYLRRQEGEEAQLEELARALACHAFPAESAVVTTTEGEVVMGFERGYKLVVETVNRLVESGRVQVVEDADRRLVVRES